MKTFTKPPLKRLIRPLTPYKNFIIILFIAANAIFSINLREIDQGVTEFYIDWNTYQYKIKSLLNLDDTVSLNERFYMRNQVKELILKKISSGMESLYIDNSHKVSDILEHNVNFQREYPLYLQNIHAVRMNFKSSYIEASTALPLRGSNGLLGHLPIPWGTMKYYSSEDSEYVGEAYQRPTVSNEYESGLVPLKYTGIIIDLRNMDATEALAPRIYTQTGRLIYGPEYIHQKIGIQRGIVAYVNSMDDPEVKIRAGEEPFYTVALSTKGLYKTDVVISNQDAGRILQHKITLENLQKCRVIFIVDKKNT